VIIKADHTVSISLIQVLNQAEQTTAALPLSTAQARSLLQLAMNDMIQSGAVFSLELVEMKSCVPRC
jgi:hypothetical protein